MVPIPRNVVTKAAGGLGRRQLLTQPEIVIPLPRDFGFYALFADLPRTDWARALLCFPQSPIFPSQLPPCRLIEPFPEWHLFRSILDSKYSKLEYNFPYSTQHTHSLSTTFHTLLEYEYGIGQILNDESSIEYDFPYSTQNTQSLSMTFHTRLKVLNTLLKFEYMSSFS